MADLNHYCTNGKAVHDSDNSMQCNCPHGMLCCRALFFNIVPEFILDRVGDGSEVSTLVSGAKGPLMARKFLCSHRLSYLSFAG